MGYLLLILLVICMCAMLLFLIVRVAAICARATYAMISGKEPPAILSRSLLAITWISILFVAPIQGCEHLQVKSYEKAIPSPLQFTELTYHDEQSGLLEGCGVAIFKLSPRTLASINQHGLAFLASATVGRDGSEYHHYETWQRTPPTDSSRTRILRGSPCINRPPDILRIIGNASYQPGSFFTTGREQDLVIVPSLGVLVFSYDG